MTTLQTIALLIICRQLDLIRQNGEAGVGQLCQFVGGEGGIWKSRARRPSFLSVRDELFFLCLFSFRVKGRLD